ncbi:uncharacterized protein DS421_12g365650 [Arachis hypogaea]|nr:uncharacterized protein DS421_12g365650 [Arachis hypogaea]
MPENFVFIYQIIYQASPNNNNHIIISKYYTNKFKCNLDTNPIPLYKIKILSNKGKGTL